MNYHNRQNVAMTDIKCFILEGSLTTFRCLFYAISFSWIASADWLRGLDTTANIAEIYLYLCWVAHHRPKCRAHYVWSLSLQLQTWYLKCELSQYAPQLCLIVLNHNLNSFQDRFVSGTSRSSPNLRVLHAVKRIFKTLTTYYQRIVECTHLTIYLFKIYNLKVGGLKLQSTENWILVFGETCNTAKFPSVTLLLVYQDVSVSVE